MLFLDLRSKVEHQAVSCCPGRFDVEVKPNNHGEHLHDKPYRFRHFSPKPHVARPWGASFDLWSNLRPGASTDVVRQRTTGRVGLDTS